MKTKKIVLALICIFTSMLLLYGDKSDASTNTIPNSGFETGDLTGWDKGTQTGTLVNGNISGNGTGVTLFNGSVNFAAGSFDAVGNPTLSNGSPNPYYAPAVVPTTWVFSSYGNHAVALQPTGSTTFDQATGQLGLTPVQNQAIKDLLIQQQQASGLGNPNPTNAAWITKTVTLDAGVTYLMSWNYIGTDYVPFNDGSITSLVYTGSGSTPTVTVNNSVGNYAILGFTNPGTGDYSTGTYGSTGWQVSTYQVSISGEYRLGFASFNLGDTSLSPVLLVDSQPGLTTKNGQPFGAVAPNNPNAPTVPSSVVTTTAPTTTTEPATTTEPSTTTEPATTTVVETTTTEPVIENVPEEVTTTPEFTYPSIVTLPITGSDSNYYLLGVFFFVLGFLIVKIRSWFSN